MANRFDNIFAPVPAPANSNSTPASLLTPEIIKKQEMGTTKINRFSVDNKVTRDKTFDESALGQTVNTIKGLLPAALNVAKNIALAGPKVVAKIGQTTGQGVNQVTGNQYPDEAFTIKKPAFWQDPLGHILVGDDKELKPLANEIEDSQLKIKNSPFAQKMGLDKHAAPIAVAGSVLGAELDLLPAGGEKNLIKELALETDAFKVVKLLLKSGVNKEIAEKSAPIIAAMSDKVEVEDALNVLKNVKNLELLSKAESQGAHQGQGLVEDLNKATNSLANSRVGEKPGSIERAKAEIKAGNLPPLKLRTMEDGTTLIEDGRHHLQAANELGLKHYPVEDVTSKYAVAEQSVAEKAKIDWQENYAGEHEYLHQQAKDLQVKLAQATTDRDKGYIQGEINNLSGQQERLEFEFVNKWRKEAGLPEEDLRIPGQLTADEYDALSPAERRRYSGSTDQLGNEVFSENIPGKSEGQLQHSLENTTTKLKTPLESLDEIIPGETKSLKPLIDQSMKTVKDKVHAMDYFQTPEFVLQKLGLGKESDMLHSGWEAYKKQVKVEIDRIISWQKEVGDTPEASKQIFRYLDGEKGVELSPVEQKVADEMKAYLAQWADKLGLPEDKRIASYITHIFEKDFIQKEFDPELAKLIEDRIPGSVYDPFLQERLGKNGYKQDVFAALDAYVKRGTRKVNMDPALEALKKGSEGLDVESTKYIQRLASRINLRPTEVDNLIDNFIKNIVGYKFGQRPVTAISQAVRTSIYRGTLGLNFGSALRNLTQGVNTYSALGEKNTIKGYFEIFKRLVTNNLDELTERGILQDDLIQDQKIGVYKSLLQKLDKGLFYMFETAEKINRGAAYYGAKAKYIGEGKTEEEAVDLAKRLVRKTQFAFGNIDSPVIMSSDLAKTIGQLQTFNIKQIEFLKNMIKNKEYAGLVRFTTGSLAMVYTIGRLFGMTPADLVPTIRTGGTVLGNAFGVLTGLLSTDEQKRSAAKAKIGQTLSTFIPAGSQIRKTFSGIKAVMQGKDTTPTGRVRFKVPQTTGNYIRAGLFGKTNLDEAQQYYNNIGKPKAKSGNRFSGTSKGGGATSKNKFTKNRFSQ